MGEVDGFEETKAYWVGLACLYEREKQGLLPRGMAETMMNAHVKECLKALANAVKPNCKSCSGDLHPLDVVRITLKPKSMRELDDDDKQAIINAGIFLKTGLITQGTDGKYVFNPDKIEAVYEAVTDTLIEFVEVKTNKSALVLKRWIRKLVDIDSPELAELRTQAVAGKLRHNAKAKEADAAAAKAD